MCGKLVDRHIMFRWAGVSGGGQCHWYIWKEMRDIGKGMYEENRA